MNSATQNPKIYNVRPSLGNPLILTPNELKRFETTVAGRTDSVPSAADVERLLRQDPPKIGWKNKSFPLGIHRVYGLFRHPKYEPNYGEVKHAETSAQQQYYQGYRWEMRVEVGIDENEIEQLEDLIGWPTLLNVAGHYHAVYVHETLKKGGDFTVFQITDPHIAQRNDKIPEVLCQVRNKKECELVAAKYINFNDNLRAFIKMANERWKVEDGKVIVALTGDIVDHYFDGWWDGKFICGQGGFAEDRRKEATGSSWGYSNVAKFREIILGIDKKGEELLCPIYIILGNHDYYMNEVLLNFDINLGPFKLKDMDTNRAFGLSPDEGREYDHWAFPRNGGKHKSIRERKNFKENITKNTWKASLNQDWSFWLIKPKSWQLSQYLDTINYDLDFKFDIDRHQFLFLNTGYERYPRMEEIIGLEQKEKEDKDWLLQGPHNRGITTEQMKIVDNAMNNSKKGFVFVFTHAPLVGLQKNATDGVEVLYEENHENANPVLGHPVSQWLSKVFGIPIELLPSFGFTLGSVKYFKRVTRDPLLNFNCADGEAVPFLRKISRISGKPADKVVFVLSGHTHKVHEFRTELLPRTQGPAELAFFIDDYTTKYLKDVLKTDMKRLLRAIWLVGKTPFLFTSGAFKSKRPIFREIVIKNDALDHMALKEVPNIVATADFSPGCRAIALRAHNGQYVCAEGGGGRELVANRNHIREWETFELSKLDTPHIALRAHNHQFVRAEGGGGGRVNADRSEIDSHELFRLHQLDDSKVALQTADKGKYVCAEGGGGREVVANRDRIGPWETFQLIELDSIG